MPAPATAVDQQIVWKHDEMRRFALALIREAVKLASAGVHKFTTDIVPDAERGSGTGIAGSTATQLKNAHVIEHVGVWSGDKFYPERVPSTRDGRKSAYVNVYQLTSAGVGREFLARNDQPAPAPETYEQTPLI